MKITKFRIENFRNIRLAECADPPDFMVICGGNGSGKSALLQALMTAKEHAGSYGNFAHDPRAVSANAEHATISITLSLSQIDRDFVQREFSVECPAEDEIQIEINKGGAAKTVKRSSPVASLLTSFSQSHLGSPGFFDFIDPYRHAPKLDLSDWNPTHISEHSTKNTLAVGGAQKFQHTKRYLAGLKMKDLQATHRHIKFQEDEPTDSLAGIREFFDDFFAPMQFIDVDIDESPFKFIVKTSQGDIDIDDLSSGEKEIFNVFVRFHQLKPENSIILFDEADAHLHPDLERRYLHVLRDLSKRNQVWITTHSPEMMIAAGSKSLYTVLKQPVSAGQNQFMRVANDDHLHSVLSEIMGSRGLVSFNQRIIFIEGEESSADREVYERLYPPGAHNVSFVPVGNSATVRKTSERVNELLSVSVGFQQYFSLVDKDIERTTPPPAGSRLFQLPVYHVENFLIDPELMLEVTKDMLASNCPHSTAQDVEDELKNILCTDAHLNPFSGAVLDARIAKAANDARDAVFQKDLSFTLPDIPSFQSIQQESIKTLQQSISDGSWKGICKGRELIKAYCNKHGINYLHFRNSIISKMTSIPLGLKDIMDQILS